MTSKTLDGVLEELFGKGFAHGIARGMSKHGESNSVRKAHAEIVGLLMSEDDITNLICDAYGRHYLAKGAAEAIRKQTLINFGLDKTP